MSHYFRYIVECGSGAEWEFYARSNDYDRASAYVEQAKLGPRKCSVRIVEMSDNDSERVIFSYAPVRRRRTAA